MKSITRTAGLFALSLYLTTALPGHTEELNITVYGGQLGEAIKKLVITPFSQESKIHTVVDDRDWGIGVLRARMESGSSNWDVVASEDIELIQACDEGLLQKIDKSKLPVLDSFLIPVPDDSCGVPMVLYNTAIAYDKSRVGTAPKTWADFWDTKKWPGKRSLRKQARDTLEIALLADGVPREKIYDVLSTPEGVDRAFKKLDEIKADVNWWTNAGQARQMLASGEIIMAATYDSGVLKMNRTEHTNFGVSLDGAISGFDSWAITSDSKNTEAAYKFIDYASQAKPEAAVSTNMTLSMPNKESIALVDPAIRPFLSADPKIREHTLASNTQFWLNNNDALTQRFESWLAR